MTTILAIDSATGPCSVALWKNGRIAAYIENLTPAAQSATLMPMVEQVLAQCNTPYAELSVIAATVGPGSFTGIRIGLAAARGIAFASTIKTLGFSTLEVMAYTASARQSKIMAILNAGKGEHYFQAFETRPQWQPLMPPQLGTLEEANTLAQDALITSNTGIAATFPRADTLAELAANRPQSAMALTPFYIRPPDAKLPMKKT